MWTTSIIPLGLKIIFEDLAIYFQDPGMSNIRKMEKNNFIPTNKKKKEKKSEKVLVTLTISND